MINTFLQTKTTGGEDRLVDNVYAIIDSKIQYLEYEKEKLVSNCLTPQSGTYSSSDSRPCLPRESEPSLLSHYERLQEQISTMSHSVRLLLFIRSHLLRHNARIAFGLLTDCTYLKYSEEHLYQMLWSSKVVH